MGSNLKAIDLGLYFGSEEAIESCSDDIVIEAQSRLHELPPGRWRSLGRHLDYTNWADRDRFVQLDWAIRLSPDRSIAKPHSAFRD